MKEVCKRHHLGSEDELTGVKSDEDDLTGVKSDEEYLRMQKSASLSPEKTLMHLSKYSLLYCWVHKVLQQKCEHFHKTQGRTFEKRCF